MVSIICIWCRIVIHYLHLVDDSSSKKWKKITYCKFCWHIVQAHHRKYGVPANKWTKCGTPFESKVNPPVQFEMITEEHDIEPCNHACCTECHKKLDIITENVKSSYVQITSISFIASKNNVPSQWHQKSWACPVAFLVVTLLFQTTFSFFSKKCHKWNLLAFFLSLVTKFHPLSSKIEGLGYKELKVLTITDIMTIFR